MGKKRDKKTSSEPIENTGTSPNDGGNAGRWVAVALMVLGTGVFLYAISTEGPPKPSSLPTASQTAATDHSGHDHRDPGQTGQYRYFEDPAQAQPLPVTLPPSEFQNAGIANSYAIAKEIPEVLVQQPCLCGCDNTSDDHRSLLDCYIDDHASTCMVCMKEAVYAKTMTEEGRSGEWIRESILRHEFSDVNIGN